MVRMNSLVLTLLGFAACDRVEDVERVETLYPDGGKRSVSVYLREPGGPRVPHGVQMAWYPDGSRRSMEVYLHGRREGYSLEWHPDGRMRLREQFMGGRRVAEAVDPEEAVQSLSRN